MRGFQNIQLLKRAGATVMRWSCSISWEIRKYLPHFAAPIQNIQLLKRAGATVMRWSCSISWEIRKYLPHFAAPIQNIQLLKRAGATVMRWSCSISWEIRKYLPHFAAPKILIQFSLEDLSSEGNSVQTRMHSSRMRTTSLSNVCVVATTRCQCQWGLVQWGTDGLDLGIGLSQARYINVIRRQFLIVQHHGVWSPPSPLGRMTDSCENITFPQLRLQR